MIPVHDRLARMSIAVHSEAHPASHLQMQMTLGEAPWVRPVQIGISNAQRLFPN